MNNTLLNQMEALQAHNESLQEAIQENNRRQAVQQILLLSEVLHIAALASPQVQRVALVTSSSRSIVGKPSIRYISPCVHKKEGMDWNWRSIDLDNAPPTVAEFFEEKNLQKIMTFLNQEFNAPLLKTIASMRDWQVMTSELFSGDYTYYLHIAPNAIKALEKHIVEQWSISPQFFALIKEEIAIQKEKEALKETLPASTVSLKKPGFL